MKDARPDETAVIFDAVSRRFGETTAVEAVSFTVGRGELVTLLGPSGCGKTTTLRLIAGLELPSSGRIEIAGRDVTALSASQRDVAMVFQSYALFPHMTVFENVAYGLTMSGLKRADVRARVEGVLETVGLTGLGPRMPAALSGGQQQRVAVARAVVLEPDVLLFDEPLSNLDAKLRRHVRDEIRELQQRLGLTAVYVTHDQEEALAISDRVIVMNAGRIAQEGTPRDLYERPASRFVADFIGDANLLDAAVLSVEGDVALVALGPLRLSTPARGLRPGPAGLAVRPHAVRLAAPGEPGVLPASVVRSVYLGARTEIAFDTEAGPLFAVLDSLGAAPPAGARVGLRIDERAVALLPSD